MQKNIDGHGRIYIPKELRRRYGLGKRATVTLVEKPAGIMIVTPLNQKEVEDGEKEREKEER